MHDTSTTVATLKEMVDEFVREREWNQFHSPKNLAMDIAVEAAELMELFMWGTTQEAHAIVRDKNKDVKDELADVLIALLAFANAADIDLAQAFADKLAATKCKYPVDKVKGRSDKYTAYAECKKG